MTKEERAAFAREAERRVRECVLSRRGQALPSAREIQRETGITDRHILGVLTAIVRDGKTISVQDRNYLRKVHLWCDFFWIRAAILWTKALPWRVRRKLRRWKGRA